MVHIRQILKLSFKVKLIQQISNKFLILFTFVLIASTCDCQCMPNTSGCLICLDTEDCSICASQYYLYIQYCQPCPEGCFQCFSSSICLNCLTGYALVQNMCQICPQNCIQCQNSSSCQKCLNGFYVNQNNYTSCDPCPQFCLYCNNSDTCLLCMAYYGINTITSICQFCALRQCLSCQFSFNQTKCLGCAEGFFLNHQSLCVSCFTGCSFCKDLSGACISCESSYYLNSTIQQCDSCSQYCQSCTNFSYCTECFRRYIVQIQNNTFICGGECQNPYCIICQNYTFCNKCIMGGPFVQNYQTGDCQLCGVFIVGCYACNSTTICTQCFDNYFLNIFNNTCSSCPNACQTCTSLTQCGSCISNQYSFSNNFCLLCQVIIPNCVLCTGVQCNQCQLGYKLVGSICLGDQFSIGAIWVVLIVFTSLILLIAIGLTIYTWCKNQSQQKYFQQHTQENNQNHRSERQTCIQIS